MKEFVGALHAIWHGSQTPSKLDFRAEFYRHMLMPPFFSPPRDELDGLGVPRVFLGGSLSR